jgi:hypothetical protein
MFKRLRQSSGSNINPRTAPPSQTNPNITDPNAPESSVFVPGTTPTATGLSQTSLTSSNTGLFTNSDPFKFLGESRLGLTQVHNPPDPVVDIIFIHGLNGASHRSWSHSPRGRYNPSYFWPEWLPEEPRLSKARINVFGYMAPIMTAGNKVSLVEIAMKLVQEMLYVQEPKFGSVRVHQYSDNQIMSADKHFSTQ